MKFTKVVFANISSQIFGKIPETLLSIATISLLARYLSVEEFGIYWFVFSFISIFSPIADIGMSPILTRELSKDKKNGGGFLGNVILLRTFLTFFTFIIILLFSSIFLDNTKKIYVILYSFILLVYPITAVNSVYYSELKIWYLVIFNNFKKLLFLLQIIISIVLKLDFVYYFLFQVFNEYVVSTISFVIGRRIVTPIYKPSYEKIKFLLKESMPLFLIVIISLLYTKIDTLMLMFLKSENEVGIYNGALQFYNFLLFFPAVVNSVVFPLISKYSNDMKRFAALIRVTLTGIFLLGVAILLIFVLFGRVFILSFLSLKFKDSVSVFNYLLIGVPFLFANIIFGSIFIAINQQKKILMVAIFNLFLNIALNLLLIPKIGPSGAAIATAFTQIFGFSLCCYIFYRVLKKKVVFSPNNLILDFKEMRNWDENSN
ncbi:MAG: flippase [Elusimicrobiota bacterium]